MGMTAQALLIASAMPTSVNSAVIAEEYKNYPDFAAQVVLFSTIISAFTCFFRYLFSKYFICSYLWRYSISGKYSPHLHYKCGN